jgi:hypothetical protein
MMEQAAVTEQEAQLEETAPTTAVMVVVIMLKVAIKIAVPPYFLRTT